MRDVRQKQHNRYDVCNAKGVMDRAGQARCGNTSHTGDAEGQILA
jgi:hypothetical protein